MGTFKKLLGTALVAGATVGGAFYLKKRKEERKNGTCDNNTEKYKDQKVVEVLKEDENGTISLTINTKKLKATTDMAADKILDVASEAKESIKNTVGEENIQAAKNTINKVKDVSVDAVNNAKDFVVEKIGEENIETAKEKVKDVVDVAKEKVTDVVDTAKEKVTETVEKYTNAHNEDVSDEDFFEDELEDL